MPADAQNPKHTRVKNGGGDHAGTLAREPDSAWSVAQAQSFGLGAHVVECCSPLGVPGSLVGQYVCQPEAAMVACGASAGQRALLDQSDQVWPGDVEDVGRLLCGELGVHGKNGDRVALREFPDDAYQHLTERAWQFHRLAPGAEQPGGRRFVQGVTYQCEKPGLLRWRKDEFG